jgi:hypothetical protein
LSLVLGSKNVSELDLQMELELELEMFLEELNPLLDSQFYFHVELELKV